MNTTTLGKLKNIDGGKELTFSMNPTDFKLSKSYEFLSEPCQGQPAPLIAFKSGGHAHLSFELTFDSDTDKDFKVKDLRSFLDSLNVVHDKNQSVPQLEFNLGSFAFKGYATQVSLHAYRFDGASEIAGAKVAFTLVSTGEYENAKS
jgi:hypothetical protein